MTLNRKPIHLLSVRINRLEADLHNAFNSDFRSIITEHLDYLRSKRLLLVFETAVLEIKP